MLGSIWTEFGVWHCMGAGIELIRKCTSVRLFMNHAIVYISSRMENQAPSSSMHSVRCVLRNDPAIDV